MGAQITLITRFGKAEGEAIGGGRIVQLSTREVRRSLPERFSLPLGGKAHGPTVYVGIFQK
jgi:hypothetical protein